MGQTSVHVSQQGDVQGAQASLLPGSVDPGGWEDGTGTTGGPAQRGPHPLGPGEISMGGALEVGDKGL